MKLPVVAFCFFCAFFLSVSPVFAVSVTILNHPSEITADPFTVTASISGAASGTNYLRVDVCKEGTKNYFGETYNGSDWYGGSEGKEYFPVTIVSGEIWSGDISARAGEFSGTDYDGLGSYSMRIRRYTSSGGLGSEDANDSAVSVVVHIPTPTPSAGPTDTPVPTPKPSHTTAPTHINTPVPTKTPSPTNAKIPTLIIKPSETVSPSASVSASASAVLGAEDNQTKSSVKPLIVSLLLVGIGCAILSLVFVWKKRDACILEE